MKKKIVLATILTIAVLAGCASSEKTIEGGNVNANVNESQSVEETASEEKTESSIKVNGYGFNYKGTDIYVDGKMQEYIDILGEADSYFEAPSCAFDGIQKIYTYGSIELSTYIGEDGEDYLDGIIVKDDLVTTPEGARIGDSIDTIIEIYGEDYSHEADSYIYEKDNMKLTIIFDNKAAVSIQYKSKTVG